MTQPKRLLDDCFLHDSDRMLHDDALALLRERIVPVTDTETIDLNQALNRVLAQEVVAPRDVPMTDNTAVDGYAFSHADYLATGGTMPVVDRVAAGHPAQAPIAKGAAVRIFTGGVMPAGTDSIAMQEDCSLSEEGGQKTVFVPPGLKPGANCRKAGEDLRKDDHLMSPGMRLRPQEIAALASIGMAEIQVLRPLRIALISTGDEIVRPGNPIAPGQVYDSNHYLLTALLSALGLEVTDYGILPDRDDAVRDALNEAAASHDVILTTGGASQGEEDYIAAILDEIGHRHLWQLAIKPGRPIMFGQINDCVLIGLPGNPVAVFVCFLLYARPVLLARSGAGWSEPIRYQVPAAFAVSDKKTGRREFQRGILDHDENGHVTVRKFARDGSGLITSLRQSDGLIEMLEDTTELAIGETVNFIPNSEFGLPPR